MKLLTRTAIWYMSLSLLLFLLAGGCFYFITKSDIEEDFTEDLFLQKAKVERMIVMSGKLPEASSFNAEELIVRPTASAFETQLKDANLFNHLEEEMQEYRMITFPVQLNGQFYSVSISKPLYQSEDLVESVVTTFAIVSISTLILLAALNWWLSKQLWRPFYSTLEAAQTFDLTSDKPIQTEPTNIHEFNLLNRSIRALTEKVLRDFQNLKEFSENASHELQTPLAVVRAKLDVLMNSLPLSDDQYKLVADAQDAISRLNRINQSLLLLSKIENDQFPVTNQFEISALIQKKAEEYSELMSLRNITCSLIDEIVNLDIHPELAEILISNLWSNAIRHNVENGSIEVSLNNRRLEVSNTGSDVALRADQLFQRFNKGSVSSESSGLGLAIVQSICKQAGWVVTYAKRNSHHVFSVEFGIDQISTES